MDNNFNELYQLWDQFLTRCPADKLPDLTLDEFTGIGDKDTFTYWLERKTQPLGSIAGGSSEKFGIYRRAGEAKDFRKHMANGDSHTWNKIYFLREAHRRDSSPVDLSHDLRGSYLT